MTDSSKRRVALVAGSGTPVTPTWLDLNRTTSNLKANIGRIESRLIRTTRDVFDNVDVSRSAGGTLETELHYDVTGGLWRLFKGILQTTTETAATTQITGVTGSGSNTLTAGSIDTGIEVGDVVRVLTSADVFVGFYRVTVVASGVLTVEGAGTEINVANLKVQRGIRIKNGSTTYPSAIQVSDDTDGDGSYDKFEVLTNMNPDTMELRIADQEITMVSFGFVGADSDGGSGTETAGSSHTTAPSTEVFNSKSHVKALRVAATNFQAKEFSIATQNGLAPRTVIGTLPAISIRSGTMRTTGRITAYFSTFDEYTKAINGTASAILIAWRNAAGQGLAFSFPKIKYSDQERPDTGQDTDIFVNLPFATLNAGGSDLQSVRIYAFAS